MGCFSFLCKKSGKAALSTSFSGSPVYIFLLKNGKVIEEMYGNYDSYGRVFKKELRADVAHELHESFEWKMDWHEVCNLMFSDDETSGIAVILASHYDGVPPTTRSEGDPNQGWGSYEEGEEDLMGDCSSDKFAFVDEPYHKVHWEGYTNEFSLIYNIDCKDEFPLEFRKDGELINRLKHGDMKSFLHLAKINYLRDKHQILEVIQNFGRDYIGKLVDGIDGRDQPEENILAQMAEVHRKIVSFKKDHGLV